MMELLAHLATATHLFGILAFTGPLCILGLALFRTYRVTSTQKHELEMSKEKTKQLASGEE